MEAFVFVRRTPRALNFHASVTRPAMVRKAGTQKQSIVNDVLRVTYVPESPAFRGCVKIERVQA